MTLRKYSKLTSSSDIAVEGEAGRGEPLLAKSDVEDVGERASGPSAFVAQYPTPGFRWRSKRAAEDCTFLSSSRKVYNIIVTTSFGHAQKR